jgi:hypothetical protein
LDSSQIQLPGSEIAAITLNESTLRLHLSRAYLVKSMTGSAERTLWWQAGELILEDVEGSPRLPEGPLICAGGDVDDNIYTYRDMVPVPFESRGHIGLQLRFEGTDATLIAAGRSARLVMAEVPKYIEHLRSA